MPPFRLLILFFCILATETIYGQSSHSLSTGETLNVLTVTATVTNPTCETRIQTTSTSTLGNGSINATATGGIPPYKYTMSPGGPYQTSGYFPDLNQNNYFVQVMDATGATAKTFVYLSNTLPEPILSVQVLQLPSTCTSNDGSLELFPYYGTPPYTYSLDGGVSYQSGSIVNNLSQGYFQIFYLKDANGCIATGLTSGGRTLPNYFMCFFCCPLQIDMVYDSVSCMNDGKVTVWANMPGPIYYSLDGINYSPGNGFNGVVNTFSNLSSGSHSVYAKNDLGYTGGISFIMPEACATSSLSFITSDAGCNQSNGRISVTASFGTPPYTYSLDGVNYQNSNVFSGLSGGSYQISVKDGGGTLTTGYSTLNNLCPLLTAASTNEQCSGKNASITAFGSGGVLPYSYSIDGINFQSGNVFAGLSAANYNITMKDGAGQLVSAPVLVTGTSAPVMTNLSLPLFCDNARGVLSISATGAQPLLYSLDSGLNYQSSNTFSNIRAGNYLLMVQDMNGCTTDTTIKANTYLSTPFFLGVDTVLCEGQKLTLSAPSSPLYNYLWQDKSVLNNLNVSQAGTYFVRLTDENNCSTSDTIVIRYNSVPFFSLGADTSLCYGSIFKLHPSVSGNYLWSNGNQTTSINITSNGLYWLEVDKQNCSFRDSILVSFKLKPVISLGNDTTICEGESIKLDVTNPGASYSWQDGNMSSTYQIESPGTYSVKVSMNGCDTSGAITVNYLTKPIVNIGSDTTLCFTQQLLLDASYPQSTYLWQDGSLSPRFNVTTEGQYTVDIMNACGDSKNSIKVSYENCACKFSVPNAFSPNNDGVNDVFIPKNQCLFSDYNLTIFNRWGQLLFSSKNASVGWDGRFKNEDQPTGTYVWILSYKDILTGKKMQKNGILVLLR
jgi:gliding motility-associated-like protein